MVAKLDYTNRINHKDCIAWVPTTEWESDVIILATIMKCFVTGLIIKANNYIVGKWWAMRDSNSRHPRCKRGALPAELIALDLLYLVAGGAFFMQKF